MLLFGKIYAKKTPFSFIANGQSQKFTDKYLLTVTPSTTTIDDGWIGADFYPILVEDKDQEWKVVQGYCRRMENMNGHQIVIYIQHMINDFYTDENVLLVNENQFDRRFKISVDDILSNTV